MTLLIIAGVAPGIVSSSIVVIVGIAVNVPLDTTSASISLTTVREFIFLILDGSAFLHVRT